MIGFMQLGGWQGVSVGVVQPPANNFRIDSNLDFVHLTMLILRLILVVLQEFLHVVGNCRLVATFKNYTHS